MNLSKYKLIIFDCDGTLVDSEGLINQAFATIMQNMGFAEFSYEYCLENFSGMSYPNIVKKLLSIHPNAPFKEIEELFIEEANRIMPTQLKAIKGANALLESLVNTPKCIASNGEREVVSYSLEIAGLDHFFPKHEIFTYEDVKLGKPAPDMFLHAAKTMGHAPSECLVFEDSIIGLTAAKAAGMDAICVHTMATGEHAFNKLAEIKKLGPIYITDDLEKIAGLF